MIAQRPQHEASALRIAAVARSQQECAFGPDVAARASQGHNAMEARAIARACINAAVGLRNCIVLIRVDHAEEAVSRK